MFRETIDSLDHITIIVDGLDECENATQQSLCDILTEFIAHRSQIVKVFVTCRTEEKPLKYLRSFSMLHMNATSTKDDIHAYVVSTIQPNIDRGDLVCKTTLFRDEIVRTLVNEADGM